ncbi:MAG: SH3 domain-containing protein, partial [Planctomycetota bacterium]|nr:SH3 domain-containing protein [Planctomycetota bacterium]
CEVCREQLVIALYKKSRPVAITKVQRSAGLTFNVTSSISDAEITWNGVRGSKVLTIPTGTAWDSLTIKVTDKTAWVRSAAGKQQLTKTFTVHNPNSQTNSPSSRRWVDRLIGSSSTPAVADAGTWTPNPQPTVTSPATPRTTPPTTNTPAAWPRSARVVGVTSSLNVRLGPSTRTGVVGSLGPNSPVIVTGTPMAGWSPVRLANGTRGFVASKYLRISSAGMTGAMGDRN